MPRWILLFPLTFALHVLEESVMGETFPVWMSRISGAHLARGEFFLINAVGMLVIGGATLAARNNRGPDFLVATLGTLVTVNGTAHTVATLVTRSYSPGLVTGALLWIPLGVLALRHGRATIPRARFVGGVVLGVMLQLLVSAVALTI